MNESSSDQNFKSKPFLALFLVVIGIAIYQLIIDNKINEKGIYTKCLIVNSEGYKGGIQITIKYKIRGKEYAVRMNSSSLGKSDIGNQYFIKLLPEKPKAVILIEEFSVPDCLVNVEAPYEGWKELPKCQ